MSIFGAIRNLGRAVVAKVKRQPYYKVEIERDPLLKEALKDVNNFGKGMTEKEVNEMWEDIKKPMTEAEKKAMDEIGRKYFERKGMNVAAVAVVATQSPSFATKKDVYDSLPSTKSIGQNRATTSSSFKQGVINMAKTMDANASQISKLLKMDAEKLEILYHEKSILFDLYFEYSFYDDFEASHEDSGINKLIDSYEYRFGEIL